MYNILYMQHEYLLVKPHLDLQALRRQGGLVALEKLPKGQSDFI